MRVFQVNGNIFSENQWQLKCFQAGREITLEPLENLMKKIIIDTGTQTPITTFIHHMLIL